MLYGNKGNIPFFSLLYATAHTHQLHISVTPFTDKNTSALNKYPILGDTNRLNNPFHKNSERLQIKVGLTAILFVVDGGLYVR